MTDQCGNCTVKGDFEQCQKTPCEHHENWYAGQSRQKIARLEAEIERLEKERDSYREQLYSLERSVLVAITKKDLTCG